MKIYTKYFSVIIAFCIILSCVFVPVNTFAVSNDQQIDNTNSTGYYYTDFTESDFKLFDAGEKSADSDGNEFYPFTFHSYYGDSKTVCETELVTLTDGDGNEKTLLDIKSVSAESGKFVQEVSLIPTDANGKPFVIDNNATYKVEYKFYVKNVSNWRNLGFGRGGIHSYTANGNERLIDGNTTAVINYPYTSKNYQYNSNGGFEERVSETGWLLPNATNRVNITYETSYTATNWYDKPLTGTLIFKTDSYDVNGNKFSITANDGSTVLTYNNYFALYLAIGYGTNVPAEILFDYVKVTKLVENVTFDANEGKINNADSVNLERYSGELLPIPTRDGDWIFDGWFFEDGTNAGDKFNPSLNGKKLIAKWAEGVVPKVYDFDHNEVITTAGDNKKITGIDGVEYTISSWCFQTNRANSAGKGRNGSNALRCGAGDQTWGVNGCYPLNDGTNFYYLQEDSCYTVTMDIFTSTEREVNNVFSLVYGPYYSGSNWSTDSIKYRAALATILKFENGVPTFPDATNVTLNDDGWYTVTYKFVAPSNFPLNDSDFPLSNILALYGNWVTGITLYFDNIVINKAPAVNFVLENGEVERQQYFIGDKVQFPSFEGSGDVYHADGTGYTTFDVTWYTDKDCTNLADTSNTVVSDKKLTFYQKNVTLFDYNSNQVSYYGFEDDRTLENVNKVSGGYESSNAAAIVGERVKLGFGTLLTGVSYKLRFFYKSSSDFSLSIYGSTADFKKSDDWNSAEISFVADGEEIIGEFKDFGDDLVIDVISVSNVVAYEGYSMLDDEAENIENKQALRTFFSYNLNKNEKIELNGVEYDIINRGIVILPTSEYNGNLTKNTNGALVVSKDSDFENCWEYNDGKLVFSAYIKDLGIMDKRGVTSVGYVTLSDGYTYYSPIQSNSVEFMKKAIIYTEKTNSYSFKDSDVLEKVVLQQRYDTTLNGVTFDWTASTLKYTAISFGKTTVNFIINNVQDSGETSNLTCKFAVRVDGVLQNASYIVNGNAGDNVSITFDIGDEFKSHEVEVTRVDERGKCLIDLVDFEIHGELIKTNEQDLLIEFIGDSVTCAGAMGGDGLSSYAYRTVHALNVDYRMVSQSGTGLMFNSSGEVNEKSVWTLGYKFENYMRSPTKLTTVERTADIVVINLGTNDVASRFAGKSKWTDDDFVKAGINLIEQVREQNPNATIVWCTRGMEGGHTNAVNKTIEAMGGAENNCYVFDFGAAYHGGSDGWHPGFEDHKTMSETMIEWFLNSGILNK